MITLLCDSSDLIHQTVKRIFRSRNSTNSSASITYGLPMGLTVDSLPVRLRNPLIPATERIRNGWNL
jgi:hypothetical protein